MRDFQRYRPQPAATGSAWPEKVAGLLTPRHLELIREAQQALHRATDRASTAVEHGAALADWQTAAERLAVVLVARLESLEEAQP